MKKSILLLLTVFLFAHTGVAGKVYQWKDDAGTHFTDNLALVPAEHREDLAPNITDYASIEEAKLTPNEIGQGIWQNTCRACHYMGDEAGDQSAKDLSGYLTDPSSGLAVEARVLSLTLGPILEDHGSFMKKKLNKNQIVSLSGYLSEAQYKSITESPENQ